MVTPIQLKRAKQAGLAAPAASTAPAAPAGKLPQADEEEEPGTPARANALDSLFQPAAELGRKLNGQARPALQKLKARGLPPPSPRQ